MLLSTSEDWKMWPVWSRKGSGCSLRNLTMAASALRRDESSGDSVAVLIRSIIGLNYSQTWCFE